MPGVETRPVGTPAASKLLWDWAASAARIDQLNRTSPNDALTLADNWLAAEVANGSSGGYARALRAHAHALRFVGRHEAALEHYRQAEERFLQAAEEPEVARTRIGRVTAMKYLGRYAEAVELAEQTRAYFLSQGDELQAAKLANNLGTIYRPLGQLAAALKSYRTARQVFRRLGERSSLADVEQNIGNVLKELGRYAQAVSHLRAAERIRRSLGLQSEVARTLLNLGALYQRCGDYGQALQALMQARTIYESLGLEQNIAVVDLDLLPVYMALNLREESVRTAEQAIRRLSELELPFELGQALLSASVLSEASDDLALAREQATEARELFTRLGNRLWEAMAELREASLTAEDDDPTEVEQALQSCREATQRLAAAQAPDRAAAGELLEGVLLARLGRFDQALGCFQRVIRAANELRADQLLYQAHASVGELLEESAPESAIASYRLALDHLEAVRAKALADDLKLSFLADKSDLYERLVTLLLLDGVDGSVDAAFAVVERSKSRTLLEELLANDRTVRPGRQSRLEKLRRQIRDIRTQLNTLYARTYSGEQTPTAEMVERSGQAQSVAQLEQRFAEATRELQLATRADGGGMSEVEEVPGSALNLPDDTALVEFYAAGSDLVAFIGRGRSLQFRCLTTLEEVAGLADRLTFHLGDGAFGTEYVLASLEKLRRNIDQSLHALWRRVIAPLESELVGVRRLVVVPHGSLHSLPFHAFRDDAGYLVERFSFTYAPSFGIYQAAQSAAQPLGDRALVVGVDDPHLPWVGREVASVAACWPRAQILAGQRATVKRLRRLAGSFDALHLATHAVFRADNPLFSSLKLADGWLTVSDLSELARGAQLVTLSACETGLGGLAVGDEVLGLTRGLLGAGCSTVVASLWPVTDETTALLMTDFYAALQAGSSPAAALRLAMLKLRGEYDHPYFWAPFITLGAG